MRPDETIQRKQPAQDRPRRLNRLLPFIVIAVFFLIILSQEIPGFRHAIDYYIAHENWQATENCNSRAMQMGTIPDYMRVIDYGTVHKTANGFFVEKIVVGEMAEQGGEQRFVVDCYTDAAGNLVRADRRAQ